MEMSNFSSTCPRREITAIVTVGIDLAKNVFAVHGVDEAGEPVVVPPQLRRAKLLERIANLTARLIAGDAYETSRPQYAHANRSPGRVG